MKATIENAARRGQPGSGAKQQQTETLTFCLYHELKRAATTTVNEGAPDRVPSLTAPSDESAVAGASPGRFSHEADPRATAQVAGAIDIQRSVIRNAISDVLHGGIRAGGIAEAQHRCQLLRAELEVSAAALELAAEKLGSEVD